jgi:hypothetical protein
MNTQVLNRLLFRDTYNILLSKSILIKVLILLPFPLVIHPFEPIFAPFKGN